MKATEAMMANGIRFFDFTREDVLIELEEEIERDLDDGAISYEQYLERVRNVRL